MKLVSINAGVVSCTNPVFSTNLMLGLAHIDIPKHLSEVLLHEPLSAHSDPVQNIGELHSVTSFLKTCGKINATCEVIPVAIGDNVLNSTELDQFVETTKNADTSDSVSVQDSLLIETNHGEYSPATILQTEAVISGCGCLSLQMVQDMELVGCVPIHSLCYELSGTNALGTFNDPSEELLDLWSVVRPSVLPDADHPVTMLFREFPLMDVLSTTGYREGVPVDAVELYCNLQFWNDDVERPLIGLWQASSGDGCHGGDEIGQFDFGLTDASCEASLGFFVPTSFANLSGEKSLTGTVGVELLGERPVIRTGHCDHAPLRSFPFLIKVWESVLWSKLGETQFDLGKREAIVVTVSAQLLQATAAFRVSCAKVTPISRRGLTAFAVAEIRNFFPNVGSFLDRKASKLLTDAILRLKSVIPAPAAFGMAHSDLIRYSEELLAAFAYYTRLSGGYPIGSDHCKVVVGSADHRGCSDKFSHCLSFTAAGGGLLSTWIRTTQGQKDDSNRYDLGRR